jgi:hypothetical protein
MRESIPQKQPSSNEGFFNSYHPEYLTGEEPEGFSLYNLHATETEMATYEKLGVKQFRFFYLATIGRLVKKLSGKNFIEGTSVEAINKAMNETLRIETAHTLGGMFMIIGHIGMFGNGHIAEGTASVALNVLVNLYPIFMQRANRHDLLNAKKRKLATLEKIEEFKNDKVNNSNS